MGLYVFSSVFVGVFGRGREAFCQLLSGACLSKKIKPQVYDTSVVVIARVVQQGKCRGDEACVERDAFGDLAICSKRSGSTTL